MRSTIPLATLLTQQQPWKYCTVEWSPKLASIQSEIPSDVVTHYIMTDLDLDHDRDKNKPHMQSSKDRKQFLATIPKQQRIQTIATSRHTPWSLRQYRIPANKILLVGGNDKTSNTMSVCDAASILQQETDIPLWGVANPNDPNSLERVEEKIQAGITGFITQPLLTSNALNVLESYPTTTTTKDDDDKENNHHITLIAGLAFPTSTKNLQFWMKLLEQEPELQNDSLFQSHLAYFSQPHYTSLAWIGRELHDLALRANIDGIHCMPIKNTDDLIPLLQTLKQIK